MIRRNGGSEARLFRYPASADTYFGRLLAKGEGGGEQQDNARKCASHAVKGSMATRFGASDRQLGQNASGHPKCPDWRLLARDLRTRIPFRVSLLRMENKAVTSRQKKGSIPARVFFIVAREAPTAVVFRRGPSRWVQLLKWDTATDTAEPGQWFRGRLYERRSDLSPDGTLLLYFAQKINDRTLADREYTYAWTAVSKPPYLTALALWPKGDCWHGGGFFRDNNTVILNHKPEVARAHPKHPPSRLTVLLKEHVHGEDDPIFPERLARDGWALKQEWIVENRGYPLMFQTHQAEVREKRNNRGTQSIQLTRSMSGLDYEEHFAFRDNDQAEWTPLRTATWADWDHTGRIVFAEQGKLYSGQFSVTGQMHARELIDLNPLKPATVVAPDWAKSW